MSNPQERKPVRSDSKDCTDCCACWFEEDREGDGKDSQSGEERPCGSPLLGCILGGLVRVWIDRTGLLLGSALSAQSQKLNAQKTSNNLMATRL